MTSEMVFFAGPVISTWVTCYIFGGTVKSSELVFIFLGGPTVSDK